MILPYSTLERTRAKFVFFLPGWTVTVVSSNKSQRRVCLLQMLFICVFLFKLYEIVRSNQGRDCPALV